MCRDDTGTDGAQSADNPAWAKPRAWIPLALALVCLTLLTWPLRDWLVDDAGIVLAYGRNLLHGHGLVSQPGQAPVEAYSNPLWMLLLSPIAALELVDPTPWVKVVSFLAVAATLWFVHLLFECFPRSRFGPWIESVALVAMVAAPPFSIWTMSGLENALYGCLFAAQLWLLVRAGDGLRATSVSTERAPRDNRRRVALSLVSAGLMLTRPEGIGLWAFGLLVVVGLAVPRQPDAQRRSALRTLAVYGLTGVTLGGAYLAFRVAYFGMFLPNTAIAKAVDPWVQLRALLTLEPALRLQVAGLVEAFLGDVRAGPLAMGLVAAAILVVRDWRQRAALAMLSGAVVVVALLFLLLPVDWMAEHRFASSLAVALFPLLGISSERFAREMELTGFDWWYALLHASTAVLALLLISTSFVPRVRAFLTHPTVDFHGVALRYGVSFNRYARHLGLQRASLLAPDLGGTLYFSALVVHDTAGLCHPEIARRRRRGRQAFVDYVFGELKPTFIGSHGAWTQATRLFDDARFRRDYFVLRFWPSNGVVIAVRHDAATLSELEELKDVLESSSPAWSRENLVAHTPFPESLAETDLARDR